MNKNESDFPLVERGGEIESVSPGLSKREYFAGLAMQSLIREWQDRGNCHEKQVAEQSVKCADALLAELEKTQS